MAMAAGLLFTACGRTETAANQRQYYYYPASNTYYDVVGKTFFYSIDAGQTWDSINATDYPQPQGLGNKQVVFAKDSIWKNNAEHRRYFNGQLLLIVDEDSAAPEQLQVSDKPAPNTKTATGPARQQPKEKKFVGRLFQKIFGKKKDKN